MFEKSILVSAHPDDEVLWFSSILDKVDEVMTCYLDIPSKPHCRAGRQRSLLNYPIRNISCLGLVESESYNGADWQNPAITKYGIEISNKLFSDKTYKSNYHKLKQHLQNKLKFFRNVFTHNPWVSMGMRNTFRYTG